MPCLVSRDHLVTNLGDIVYSRAVVHSVSPKGSRETAGVDQTDLSSARAIANDGIIDGA